jgi:hypothetical protein
MMNAASAGDEQRRHVMNAASAGLEASTSARTVQEWLAAQHWQSRMRVLAVRMHRLLCIQTCMVCLSHCMLLQASVNEAACKQLERRLQDITAKLVADRKQHADKVRTREC